MNPTVKGLLGAVLGSIPGLALWVILGYFNIFSAYAGLVIAFGIMIGYSKLGGDVTAAGVVLCIAVLLVTIYLGVHLSWSAQIYEWQPDLQMAVFGLYDWLHKRGLVGSFFGDLGMGYLFGILGAVGVIRRTR